MLIGSRYQLEELIGKGGMGEVYRAFDRAQDQIVALKRVYLERQALMHGDTSASDTHDFALSLAAEFKTLASLHHPNIIGVMDYGFDTDQNPYFTMPLLEQAIPLTTYTKTCHLSDKIRLILDLLGALSYLHRRDVIHRDIKPDNVNITGNGHLILMDFGLAQTLSDSLANLQSSLAGTIAYMAPELFTGQASTYRSDLYAVGLLIYETFSDTFPFDRRNVVQLITEITEKLPDFSHFPDPLANLLEDLLAKEPENRPKSADDVASRFSYAMDYTLPRETKTLRESYLNTARFVGRRHQLKELLTAFNEARSGRGSLVLVGGEAGVGKSRILEELRARVLTQGALVIRAQEEKSGSLPYKLWRDALPLLLLITDPTDGEASILKAIIPDIGRLLGREIEEPPQLKGQAAKRRLELTIADILRRIKQPTMLILEDLHWETESLSLVRMLGTMLDQLPLLVVGSYRTEEQPDLPEKLGGVRSFILNRLTEQEIEEMMQSILGERGKQRAVIDLLQRETEGNPLFMVEVMRALAEDVGQLQDIGAVTLPEYVVAGGVEQFIQRRLKTLPTAYLPLLRIAATVGRQLDLKLLEHLRTDKDPDLDDWLRVCANAAVLERVDDYWRFNHEKLRNAVLIDVNDETLKVLHRDIAEAVEAIYEDQLEEYAELLYYHWREAGDVERELDYIFIVAEECIYFSGRYAFARSLLERAQALLPSSDGLDSKTLFLIGRTYDMEGSYPMAQVYFELSLGVANQKRDTLGLVRVLTGLSQLHRRQGNLEVSAEYASEAVTSARQFGAQLSIADSLIALSWAKMYQQQYQESEPYLLESLAIYRQMENQQGITVALQNLGGLRRLQGRYDEALTWLEESLSLAESMGDRETTGQIFNYLGDIARYQGQPAQGEAHYQRALSIFRQMSANMLIGMSLCRSAHNAIALQKYDTAQEMLLEVIEMMKRSGALTVMLYALTGSAHYALAKGLLSEATRLLSVVHHHIGAYAYHQVEVQYLLPSLKKSFTGEDFEKAWEQGKTVNIDDAINDCWTLVAFH